MPRAAHLRLLRLGLFVWLAFWIAGLPDYYRQYSFAAMFLFSAALVGPIFWLARRVIGRARIERRKAPGFWLSFYFTVPFMLLDSLYCGLYLGHGLRFLADYWYLTVFYVVPWLIFVPVGHLLSLTR